MNIFSKMRITHKISTLMVGLVSGFIMIGVTYYVQVNISDNARNAEKDAFIYQQKLTELNQLELILRFQSNQGQINNTTLAMDQAKSVHASMNEKLKEIRALDSAKPYLAQLRKLELGLNNFENILGEKFTTLETFGVSGTGQESTLQTSLREIANTIEASDSNELIERFNGLRFAINDLMNLSKEDNRTAIEQAQNNLSAVFSSDSDIKISPTQRITLQQKLPILVNEALALADELDQANKALVAQDEEFINIITELIAGAGTLLETSVENASKMTQATQAAVTAIIFVVAMGTAVGIYLIYKSIVFPMAHMQSVIGRINRGRTKARVKILSNDELADLGIAFNKLFDERIDQLETQSKENDRLNNSIISLIQALGAIAKKDLTVKVPVSSDITGTISDAVNLLTTETASTLHEVKGISREVNDASENLQKQSTLVMQFAESERLQILATSKALKVLASAMAEVAEQSEQADKSATEAISSTQSAKKAVVETVSGIRTIRETISETEKRTKRLGDRSQEISGIVNLINTIAERTHILALNASMHAASAGEAGKGFAVVAEEVQRLAESARQSTDEISAMVNNMRVETSDTVTIMNKLISQVADGSKLAEQAGKEMEITENATRELVETVKQIATQAVQQSAVANRVRDRSTIIRSFSDKTEKQLKEQKIYTDNLGQYAEALVDRVNAFALPQDDVPTLVNADQKASNVSPIKSAV